MSPLPTNFKKAPWHHQISDARLVYGAQDSSPGWGSTAIIHTTTANASPNIDNEPQTIRRRNRPTTERRLAEGPSRISAKQASVANDADSKPDVGVLWQRD